MKPAPNKIQLEIADLRIGSLITEDVQEVGHVVAVGVNVSPEYKVGKKVFFKSWGIDIITIDDKKYYYLDIDSDALCAYEE